ncbi:DUF6907 domain-containing protein [Schaalia naturae]|uniref:DUF6907 domain-containing protein n=1 Tax=Schaalia naturae TaxID=635203 RepID=A0ABW2SQH3_9ACTO
MVDEQDRAAGRQAGACPPWCTVRHGRSDPPEDRLHQSSGLAVPVIARSGTAEPETLGEVREFVVVVSRKGGRGPTWVYVGDGEEQWLEIDAQTMSRVAEVLRQVTEELT